MRTQRTIAVLAFLAALSAAPVPAQTQRSGGGDAQKFMQQYQQVAAEKTALQAQVAQMKKDLDAAQTELATAKKERDALKARVGGSAAAAAQLAASRETAEKSLDQYKQRMTELVNRFRETATNLREVEADRTQLHKTLDERNAAFDRCAENNFKLFEISGEILDRYEHVGVFTKASTVEPFTRISRTRLGNIADEYRERALQLRETPSAARTQ